MTIAHQMPPEVADTFAWVEETLQAITTLLARPAVTLEDMQAVADPSDRAFYTLWKLLDPYREAALAYHMFTSTAHECCQHEHPYDPWIRAASTIEERFFDAHGDLMNKHLELTGDD
jgi:hypothetical protein